MATLGFHNVGSLPTEGAVNEAFELARKEARDDADIDKLKLAFASVRAAIANQTQPSTASSSQQT